MSYAIARNRDVNSDINKLYPEDRAVHEWYRFVLSFPPHLVRKYLEQFGVTHNYRVLDPFCGTGTVLVECKKLGIPSVGIEANPMAHLASRVKVDWSINPDRLMEHARQVAEVATAKLAQEGIEDNPLFLIVQNDRALQTLPPESLKLLLTDSISPLPLHKMLVLLNCLEEHRDERYYQHEQLALAKALVYSISNLHFGPEVGVGPAKHDAPVISSWLTCLSTMANDLRKVQKKKDTPGEVHLADARQIAQVLEPNSIDAVITSPPYPNEKDYTRTTRLESVLLGFIHDKAELRALKRELVRSNTRGVYKADNDDQWVAGHPEIQRIAQAIENRRIELGKTSGFERLYARVTKLYFGGIARHLADLRTILRPGAQLAYVVGDQASYLRIMIPTGQLLADIAQSLGYELVNIDLFRTRLATATKEQLREEVVVLRWSGDSGK
jgi:DNA modification methylase